MAPLNLAHQESEIWQVEPYAASVVFSIAFLCSLALSILLCACCGASKRGDENRNGGTVARTEEKRPVSYGGSKSKSKGKRSVEKRKSRPKITWIKAEVSERSEVRKSPAVDASSNRPGSPTAKVDPLKSVKPTKPTGSDHLPTILRATGLSPPPSLHPPSLVESTATRTRTRTCTVKKKSKKPSSKAKKIAKAESKKKMSAPMIALVASPGVEAKGDTLRASRKPMYLSLGLGKAMKTQTRASTRRLKFTEVPGRPDLSKKARPMVHKSEKPLAVAKTVKAPSHPPPAEKSEVKRAGTNRLPLSGSTKAASARPVSNIKPISTEIAAPAGGAAPAMSYEVQAPPRH